MKNPAIFLSERLRQLAPVSILLGVVLAVSACAHTPRKNTTPLSAQDKLLLHKYRGLQGGVLRIDALTVFTGVTITAETGTRLDGSWMVSPKSVKNLTFGGQIVPIPKTINVTWREGPEEEIHSDRHGGWIGGKIVGDYTVPVADRIPDEVLDYVRNVGGALRLKIRLKNDGVLIGWDVERIIPLKDWNPSLGLNGGVNYLLPGGDFREAQIENGVVLDPGW